MEETKLKLIYHIIESDNDDYLEALNQLMLYADYNAFYDYMKKADLGIKFYLVKKGGE